MHHFTRVYASFSHFLTFNAVMETPVYNRRISRIHTVLSIWPYSLIILVTIFHVGLFGSPLSELSTERGFMGFAIYMLIRSWLFTSPIWLICSVYMLTQKDRNTQDAFYWSLIGLAGHLVNFILVF